MKKISVIAVLGLLVIWGCNGGKENPGRVYMPDMFYSRAWETYAPIDTLKSQGINYNRKPVAGTIKRGEIFPFPLQQDAAGDTTNYILAKQIPNPLPSLDEAQMKEAERLYLVNCGICHGTALDGNGPLYKGGQGPYIAAPAKLVGNPIYENMPAGQMFYSVTYGKNLMGSYASQLNTTQRWMVIHYVKSKQAEGKATAGAAATGATAAGTDTTAAK